MSVILSIFKDFADFFNFSTKNGKIRTFIAVVLIISGIVFVVFSNNNMSEDEIAEVTKTVVVSSVSDLTGDTLFSIIGTVSAQSQAKIQSETSGRVTSVPVSLGDRISAGTVIATLENASEYATLLQAEGVYEAALAASDTSIVGVAAAKNNLLKSQQNAVSAYTNSYTTLNQLFTVNLYEVFADPERTYRTPGYRFHDFKLKEGRVDDLYDSIESALNTQRTVNVTPDTIEQNLDIALRDTELFLETVRFLQSLISQNDTDQLLSTASRNYLALLSAAEQNLVSIRTNLENASSSIRSAEQSLEQAQIANREDGVSTAGAQVKQALGGLRAAQANFAKTILRSPIAGTVNELRVENGDFVGMQDRVALIANNDALQITAYVGEQDREHMTIGQLVFINNTIEGIITGIAPAVDSVTKKFEIQIGTDDASLKNGSTVTISVQHDPKNTSVAESFFIPITAVKFTASDAEVFSVVDGALQSRSVSIGSIRGSFVEVTEGIESSSIIVKDARGLINGQSVEAVRE